MNPSQVKFRALEIRAFLMIKSNVVCDIGEKGIARSGISPAQTLWERLL
jgi:hypothetical protein